MLLLVCTQPRTAVPFPDERSSAVKMMMMNECGLCARVDSSFSGINIIKKAYFFSGVLLDQVVIINHNVFYVLVNVIFFSDRCFLERNRRLPDRKETGKEWRLFNTTTTKKYRCLLLGRMARNGSMTNGWPLGAALYYVRLFQDSIFFSFVVLNWVSFSDYTTIARELGCSLFPRANARVNNADFLREN